MKPSPCPICDNPSFALDVVDFHFSTRHLPSGEKSLPLSGIPVYYFMCEACAFTFSPEFRTWSASDFMERIYNAQYVDFDPDYLDARPRRNAAMLMSALDTCKSDIRHLDYGGGNGKLSAILTENGWDSCCYDPFPASDIRLDSLGKFNLITAFEVFEHVPDPNTLMKTLVQLMDTRCIVLFSTATSDNFLRRDARIDWWYCAPRVGHVSLFASKSLACLAGKYGLMISSFNNDWHCFANEAPEWFHRFVD